MKSSKVLLMTEPTTAPRVTMTYSEFLAKVNSLGLADYVPNTTFTGDRVLRPPYTDTGAKLLYGSPWGDACFATNVAGKETLVRHLMPDLSSAIEQLNGNKVMILTIESVANRRLVALTRNAGTSYAHSGMWSYQITKVVYHDASKMCTRAINPYMMSESVDYTFS